MVNKLWHIGDIDSGAIENIHRVEQNDKAQELLAQYPQYTIKSRYGHPEGEAFYSNDYLDFKPGYDRELANETDRIRKASRAAVENITLELELGGDKAMLEKLLNEVNF